jgi:hypothetical protein
MPMPHWKFSQCAQEHRPGCPQYFFSSNSRISGYQFQAIGDPDLEFGNNDERVLDQHISAIKCFSWIIVRADVSAVTSDRLSPAMQAPTVRLLPF